MWISREAMSLADLQKLHPKEEKEQKCIKTRIQEAFIRNCTKQSALEKLFRFFPFINQLRSYEKSYIVSDIIAGLTVGVMHIPQGMGFAMLAQLPPIYGLYTSFFPVVIYFFFGTSKHVSMGTMALISLMISAVLDREMASWSGDIVNNPVVNMTSGKQLVNSTDLDLESPFVQHKVSIAMALSLLMGLIQLLMSIFRLDFLVTYMSTPFVGGFTTGAVCHIITSQVKFLLGIKVKGYSGILKLLYIYIEIFKHITEVNFADLIIAILCMMILLIGRFLNTRYKDKLKIPIPFELIVVVLGTFISHFAKLNRNFQVAVVGPIPSGIPPPILPPIGSAMKYITEAFIMAIVGFSISVSMAKIFTRKCGYEIDANQELLAYGLCNTIGAFFNCFGGAVAPPRILLQESVGGKTQVASLVSSLLVLLVLLVMGPLFQPLPNSVLGALIIVTLLPMFLQFRDLRKLWGINKYDFSIWLTTFLAVVLLDIDLGLVVGIGFSLLTVVIRTQFAKSGNMFKSVEPDIYLNNEDYTNVIGFSGIKIFKFIGPLYFANAEMFKEQLHKKCGKPRSLAQLIDITGSLAEEKKIPKDPDDSDEDSDDDDDDIKEDVKKEDKKSLTNSDGDLKVEIHPRLQPVKVEMISRLNVEVQSVILDFSAVSYMDTVGSGILHQVVSEYERVRIEVYLAGVMDNVVDTLERTGVMDLIGPDHIYMTVHDAVVEMTQGPHADETNV